MNFIRSLKEQGLRRVLVMVLRRSIGMFLEDDIILDQLQLEPESGLVRLTDIKLDCGMLSNYIGPSELVVSLAYVTELTATVSWGALHDGCTVVVRGINVVLTPVPSERSKRRKEPASASTHSYKSNTSSEEDGEVSAGVVFLANWIDVLVAKLQLVIEDLSVYVQPGTTDGPMLMLRLNRLEIFNCGAISPKGGVGPSRGGATSSSSSSSLLLAGRRGAGSSSSDFGPDSASSRLRVAAAIESSISIAAQLDVETKVLKFEGLFVSVVTPGRLRSDSSRFTHSLPWHPRAAAFYCTDVVSMPQRGRVMIHSDAFGSNPSSFELADTSIDVRLPFIAIQLDVLSVAAIVEACSEPIKINTQSHTNTQSLVRNVLSGFDSVRQTSLDALAEHRLQVDAALRRAESKEGEEGQWPLRDVASFLLKCEAKKSAKTSFESSSFVSTVSTAGSDAFATARWMMPDEGDALSRAALFAESEFIGSRSSSEDEGANEENIYSSAYCDAQDSSNEKSQQNHSQSSLNVRCFLEQVDVRLSLASDDLQAETTTLSLQLQMKGIGIQANRTESASTTKGADISVTITNVMLCEVYSCATTIEAVRPIAWFDQDTSLHAHVFRSCLRQGEAQPMILAKSPAIFSKISVEHSGDASISLDLQDMLFFCDASVLDRWKKTIAAFSSGPEATSQTSTSLVVRLSSIRLVAGVDMAAAELSSNDDAIEAMVVQLGLDAARAERPDASLSPMQRWIPNNITFRDYVLQCARENFIGWHANCKLPSPTFSHTLYLSIELLNVYIRVGCPLVDGTGTHQPLLEVDRAACYLRIDSEFSTAMQSYELKYLSFGSSPSRKLTLRKFDETTFQPEIHPASQPNCASSGKLPEALLRRITRTSSSKRSVPAEKSSSDSPPSCGVEGGLRSNERPQPPPLFGGPVFVFDSYSIKLDAHRIDLSCVAEAISAMVNALSSADGQSDPVPSNVPPVPISGFGVKLMSEVFSCSLQSTFREFDFEANDESPRVRDNSYIYTLATREPLIELYIGGISPLDNVSIVSKRVFVGLEVENVSLFQVPFSAQEALNDCTGLRVVGPRACDGDFRIPLLHGSGFGTTEAIPEPTDPLVRPARPCVLSVATLISTNTALSTRSTNLLIELQDVVLRYDPLSRWINNLVDLVALLSLADMLGQTKLQREALRTRRRLQFLMNNVEPRERERTISGESPSNHLFQTLNLSVTVRRALIDYCSLHQQSNSYPGTKTNYLDPMLGFRFLLSIGHLTVGSNIVAKAPQFGLKIGASEITIRLTNSIFRDPRFEMIPIDIHGIPVSSSVHNFQAMYQSFEEFLSLHAFVRMGTVEKLEIMLRTKDSGGNGYLTSSGSDGDARMDLSVSVGGVVFFGCADSLQLLVQSIEYFSAQLSRVATASDALFPEEPLPAVGQTPEREVPRAENVDDSGGLLWEDEGFGPSAPDRGTQKVFKQTEEGLVIGNPRLKPSYLRPVSSPHFQKNEGADVSSRPVSILESLEPSMFAPRGGSSSNATSLPRNESWAVSETEQYTAIFDYDDVGSAQHVQPANTEGYKNMSRLDRKIAFSTKTYDTAGHLSPSTSSPRPLDGDDLVEEETTSFMRHVIDRDSSDEEEPSNLTSNANAYSGLNDQQYIKSHLSKGWDMFHRNYTSEDLELDALNESVWSHAPSASLLGSLPHIDLGSSVAVHNDDIECHDDNPNRDTASTMSSSYTEFKKTMLDASIISDANMARSIRAPPRAPRPRVVDSFGYNLTTYQEERSRLQGEDSFVVVDTISEGEANEAPEQGRWLSGQKELKQSQINPYHVPIVTSNDIDIPEFENQPPRVIIRLTISAIRFRLYSGSDWAVPEAPYGPHSLAIQRRMKAIKFHEDMLHLKRSKSKHEKHNQSSATYKKPPVQTRDIIELILHTATLHVRMYDLSLESPATTPIKLQMIRVHDILVTHTRPGLRTRRVLGYWRSDKTPRESNAPMLQITVASYSCPSVQVAAYDVKSNKARDAMNSLHRMSISLLPLRCYLDAHFIDLLRSIVGDIGSEAEGPVPKSSRTTTIASPVDVAVAKDATLPTPSLFFQHWYMAPISMKIDYEPRVFDVAKFKGGDYFELLNCFPPDGLEITMKVIRLSGVSGVMAGITNTLRIWVDEVNANLLANVANVLSSTAPLRGIASIGRGVHQHLLVVPAKEFSRGGLTGAARSVMGGFASVAQTVAKESLHAGHKVSKLVSHALGAVTAPLVESAKEAISSSDGQASKRAVSSSRSTGPRPLQRVHQLERRAASLSVADSAADVGLAQSLSLAYGSIANSVATTVENIVLVPIREYQISGSGGAISSVIRALPIAVLAPASGAAEAASHVLLGLRNEMDPDRRREEQYAYVDIECGPDGSFKII